MNIDNEQFELPVQKPKEKLLFNLHTVIMMVGPTGAGKSHFCKNHLIPNLQANLLAIGKNANVQYLSSDDLRRDMLNRDDAHKHEDAMMHASDAAFKLLHYKLDLAMTWPTAAHFVIIDTTGLSDDFRKQITEQAKAKNYNVDVVVFDYKKTEEYELYNESDPDFKKSVLQKHLKRLHSDFFKTLKNYDKVHVIKSKDFDNFAYEIKDLGYYAGCFLDPDMHYDIISDVHGCYNELVELIAKLGYTGGTDGNLLSHRDSKRRLIFVGDLIDKGPESKKVLRYVWDNLHLCHVVRGNHENYVYKHFSGKLSDKPSQELIDQYFTCVKEFEGDTEAHLMLHDIFHVAARPFFRHPNFIVTHAPCKSIYLEKINRHAMREQCRGPFYDRAPDGADMAARVAMFEKSFPFLKDEGMTNGPSHVFGHVAVNRPVRLKNKFMIDTGCVHGGELTAATHKGGGYFEYEFVRTTFNGCQESPLKGVFSKTEEEKQDFDLESLEPRERQRMDWIIRNKINFISGTLAPAASDIDNNQLESLDKALQYYKKLGVEELVIQPKYMGSRCNLYLSRNIDECYATSRNGYKIRHIELKPMFEKMQKQVFESGAPSVDGTKMVVLDGELMPWRALGAGLVDEHFSVVSAAVQSEIDVLVESGFEDALASMQSSEKYIEYCTEQKNTTLDEKTFDKNAKDKYSNNFANTFKQLSTYDHIPLEMHQTAITKFQEQVEIFGSEGETEFKPFQILKLISETGVETVWTPSGGLWENFLPFSGDKECHINLNDLRAIEIAHQFWNEIVTARMEGVVVKPFVISEDVAPGLKVRTADYLHLVYGYDYLFPEKYKKLVGSKRVGRKIKASIDEFAIGMAMICTELASIDDSNTKYKKLIANMITTENKSAGIDPRL